MTSLILISPGIRNIDQLERSIKVPKITVSALHNQDDLPEKLSNEQINPIVDLLDSNPSTLVLY